jgi:hypothetical protein
MVDMGCFLLVVFCKFLHITISLEAEHVPAEPAWEKHLEFVAIVRKLTVLKELLNLRNV